MFNTYNPFKENRAEQMKDLWKYYVPIPGIDGTGKPLVVEGGRGSGKTMLFLCNSWRENIIQLKKLGNSVTDIFLIKPFIGIYYRVDTAFVSAMVGKDKECWDSIFETYLGICLLREFLDLLNNLSDEQIFSKLELIDLVKNFSKRFHPESQIETLDDFLLETEDYLDRIEDVINGVSASPGFRCIKLGRFVTDLCKKCNELLRHETLFKIFIDEYETLQEYQQRIINTLIKHSTPPVIYNIGLRPKGMKTPKTISSTETIESPHDYEEFEISIDEKDYTNVLKRICEKRIQYGKEIGKIPISASEDIEFYLGKYSMDNEVAIITNSKIIPDYINKLRDLIKGECKICNMSHEETQKYVSVLCDNAHPINSKLHFLLLNKKTIYSPTIKELFQAYTEKNNRYKEWEHNRKFGIVFLLAKDYKKSKMYYGFDVFAALSSGIVRYFLELCEQSFKIAFLDNYCWDAPISPNIQSEATKFVSEYKIIDINGYEPVGKELRIFVQYLGRIFYQLHTSDETTLGEPEPNHFYTNDLALTTQTNELLSYAIMWNVLQVGEPTKKKRSGLSSETVDYYLNKIYIPYFGISYRDKRKINIDIDILQGLLSGDTESAKKAVKKYFKETEQVPILKTNQQLNIFENL